MLPYLGQVYCSAALGIAVPMMALQGSYPVFVLTSWLLALSSSSLATSARDSQGPPLALRSGRRREAVLSFPDSDGGTAAFGDGPRLKNRSREDTRKYFVELVVREKQYCVEN